MCAGRARKKVAESDSSALNRKSCSSHKPRAILPAPSVSVSEPPKKRKQSGGGLRAYNENQFLFFCSMNFGLVCLSLINKP